MATDIGKLALVGLVIWLVMGQGAQTPPPPPVVTPPPGGGGISFCGDTNGQSTVTFSVQNTANLTGAETFDTTYRFCQSNGECVAGTDSTAYTSLFLTCGKSYTVKGTTTSGASGDSAKYYSIVSGTGASVNSDGTVTYTPTEAAQSLIIGGKQHGVLEARLYDVKNNDFMFSDASGTASDYVAEGSRFNSTTAATGATAVGSGGEYKVKLYYRPTVDDEVYGDVGGYIALVDINVSSWDKPAVKINDVAVSDFKGQLNADESIAYSSYEYAYLVSGEAKRTGENNLEMQVFALSGINPGTETIQIDLVSRGAYTSTTNSNLVKIGAVQDDSSHTQVNAIQDYNLAIS